MNCTIRVAETKVLISFAVSAKLTCAFGFVYADCWFSHEAAHLLLLYIIFFAIFAILTIKSKVFLINYF